MLRRVASLPTLPPRSSFPWPPSVVRPAPAACLCLVVLFLFFIFLPSSPLFSLPLLDFSSLYISHPFLSPSHPPFSGLVLDLVTPMLGVRGQEPNPATHPGGTGRGRGFVVRGAVRAEIQTRIGCDQRRKLVGPGRALPRRRTTPREPLDESVNARRTQLRRTGQPPLLDAVGDVERPASVWAHS